jgi:hypothetical protein
MKPFSRSLRSLSLFVLVLASLLAASCAAKGEAEASRKPAPRVAVVADAAILKAIPRLPVGAEGLEAPTGKDAEAALAALVSNLAADPGVAGIVVWPAPDSLGAVFRKARDARPDLLLYAGGSSGYSLLLESAADLVVDPASHPSGLGPRSAAVATTPAPGSAAALVASTPPSPVEAVSPAEAAPLVAALAELARRAATGPAERGHMGEYLACLRAMTPGPSWSASYETDPESGVKSRNHIQVSSTKR